MSKRDDDSQADMEVGMTTAERRRRRRRGGGLRVPSDNVPRRASTPPVVAPVPEDPSLAMSIAYTFTSESSDPIARPTLETPVPSFDTQEGMPTVIDPVSGPVEQADFEMKTREMTAVDLEELGLSDAAISGSSLPIQRTSSPSIDITGLPPDSLGVKVRFKKRDATDPVEDVDVDIDGATTLDQVDDADVDEDREDIDDRGDDTASDFPEVDSGDVSAIEPVDPADERSRIRPPVNDTSQPRIAMPPGMSPPAPPPMVPYKTVRAATVALSEDDLEEVREARRLATQPPVRPLSTSMPPPMPPTKPPDARTRSTEIPIKPRSPTPPSVPEIDIMALEDKAAEASGDFEASESSGDFEVDVDGIVETRPAAAHPVAAPTPPAEPRTRPPSQPPGFSHPPSAPPGTRDSQPMPAPLSATREPSHAPPPPPPAPPQHASPPPPPAVHKPPPSPPPAAVKRDKPQAPMASSLGKPDGKPPRAKPWFVELFDEDYLRTLPFLTPQATQAEAEFVVDAMGLTPGAQVLDVGCGYGRHAMELAARGFHVVGLDMSTPLLVRGGEEAHRRGLTINFIRGDMRELDFEAQFDGAYCLFSTFGYFDDQTNKKTIANIARALRPGRRVLIEILNRDYVIADLPTRVWWEGDGCVVLEEVELNYFSSRIQVNRSVVFDDGRQLEQEISVRAYSLHEVGKLMHDAGLRVLEVSGAYHTRGRFFGNQSRHIIVLAERKDPSAS